MSYSLNSLKKGYIVVCIGEYYRAYLGGCQELGLWLNWIVLSWEYTEVRHLFGLRAPRV